MKTIKILILISIIMLNFTYYVFAQENKTTDIIYQSENETTSKLTDRFYFNIKGAIGLGLVNFIRTPSENLTPKCGLKGNIGITTYLSIVKDKYIGIDLNYMTGGLFNFHIGYIQDFMPGPLMLAMNITLGYNLYVDSNKDIANGFGLQATFYGGYRVLNWLVIGGDLGLNFAVLFANNNDTPLSIILLRMPIRLFVGFKF
jgi:hypothetical protein